MAVRGVTTFEELGVELRLSSGYLLGLGPGTERICTGLKGWYDPAPMRRDKTERQGFHGTFSERGWKDERLITMSGSYRAPNRAEAAQFVDRIAAFLADGLAGEFRVLDADLGERWARVYLFGKPEVGWRGDVDVDFTVEMVAPDPRKYGLTVDTQTAPPEDGGGLQYDLFAGEFMEAPGVLDFGAQGSTGIAEYTNTGTADSTATLRVQGYAPGFTITELGTGNRLVYEEAVPSGSSVTLDPRNGSVLLDGYADRSGALTVREWTRTPPGGTSRFFFETSSAVARLYVGGVPAWW